MIPAWLVYAAIAVIPVVAVLILIAALRRAEADDFLANEDDWGAL